MGVRAKRRECLQIQGFAIESTGDDLEQVVEASQGEKPWRCGKSWRCSRSFMNNPG